MELDHVQSNRNELTASIREHVRAMVDDWGIEVTRTEILDVALDEATRHAMMQQLNAERARRVLADAEAYATKVIAVAIKENGVEAAQYQVALKQVEALTAVGKGEGKQMIIVPASALDAFADAFKMLKGRL